MFYQLFFEQGLDSMFIIRTGNGRIIKVNDAALKTYGYSRAEMLAMCLKDLFDPATVNTIESIKAGTLNEFTIETRHARKDSDTFPVDVSIKSVATEEGILLLGTVRDLTKRGTALERIKKTEEMQRLNIENINDVLFTVDTNGCITYISPVVERSAKYRVEEVTGRPFAGFVHPADLPGVMASFEDTLAGRLNPYEFRVLKKDGSFIYVRTSSRPLVEDGNLVGITGILTDITERKQAEETLSRELDISAALADLSGKLLSPASIEGISGIVLEHAQRLTDSRHGYVGYIERDTGSLNCSTLTRSVWDECRIKDKCTVYNKFDDLGGWVIKNKEPVLTNQPRQDPRSAGTPPGHIPIERLLSVPAICDGILLGIVSLANSNRDYNQQDLALVERLAGLFAIAIQRKWSEVDLAESEEKLRREHQRLLDIIESLPTATFVIDRDKKVIAWNQGMEELTGTPKEEILGKSDYAYAVPLYGKPRPIMIDLLFEEDRETELLYDYVRKEGNSFYAEAFLPYLYGGRGAYLWGKISRLFDRDGNEIGAIESIHDITERKLAEEKLQAANQQLLDIIDFLPDATFVIDLGGQVIAWNHAIEGITGVCKEDIIGKGDYAYAVPFYGKPRPILIDLVFMEESEIKLQYEYVRREGDTFIGETFVPSAYSGQGAFLWGKASPLYDKDGNIAGAIESIRDISGLKHLEELIQMTGKELQLALEKLGERELMDRIIETSPAGILVVNSAMKVMFANARAEQVLGLKIKDKALRTYTKPVWSVIDDKGIPIPDEELVFRYVITTGKQVYDVANTLQWPDGTKTLLSINAAPLMGRSGRIDGAVLSIEDVTGRREIEEKITGYQKQLRSLAAQLSLVEERERRRIAEGIHDHIGQSLAVSRLKMSALKRAASLVEVLAGLDEIIVIIEEVIMKTRSLTFELSPPVLYDLGFEAVVEWLGEQILERNGVDVSLNSELKSKSPDEEVGIILFTAVRELFFNIIKHARAQKVFINIQDLGEKIMVTVRDNGIGFDTLLCGPIPGKKAGFGLFSIRERLEHLGGRLEIISRNGYGTSVSIEAPFENRH